MLCALEKNTNTLKFILFFLILSNFTFAQENISFKRLISKTNKYLEFYGEISIYGKNSYSFNEIGISKKDQKGILKNKKDYEFVVRDSIGKYDLILFLQKKIMYNLNRVVTNAEFGKNDITQLLNSSELDVIKSDDGKLYNFSIDEKTGGTYKSRVSLMHYTELNNSVQKEEDSMNTQKSKVYEVFDGDGFTGIFSIPTTEGTKYVLTKFVRGCSLCFLSGVMLVTYNDGIFQQDFSYSLVLRDWDGGVKYEPKTRMISVDYKTDDLTTDCNCKNYIESESNNNDQDYFQNVNQSNTFKCQCVFMFNGLNFELVKECKEKIIED
ncbi:hypothetical protein [Aquimarina algiphila]|uniref:hypothetical protein n=1 Tax=Aquimarina algiphila TaxID=2047982 RepID=UPI001ABF3C6D|nr:hypothetical protein [Aquimarina algiphila]